MPVILIEKQVVHACMSINYQMVVNHKRRPRAVLRVLDDEDDKAQQNARDEQEDAALGPRVALELLGAAELVETGAHATGRLHKRKRATA